MSLSVQPAHTERQSGSSVSRSKGRPVPGGMAFAGWRLRLLVLSPFLGVAALIIANPSDDGPTFCPFALATGTAGPGCGMTRAASQLFRGNLDAALAYHPLVPLLVIQLLGGWAWYLLWRAGKVRPISHRMLNVMLIGTAIALLTVWGLRMATGTLPPV